MTQRDFKLEFDSIVKETIAPILKELGFRKNGNNFYRDLGSIGQAFNVQQSQWNSKSDKTFVFNLGLIDKEINKEVYERELPKFPKEYDCDIRIRMGSLMNKGDRWYDLNKRTNIDKLKSQVKTEIETYALPFFEKYGDPNKWIEFFKWKYEPLTGPIAKYLIISKYENKKSADKFWNTHYNEALIPKPQVTEIHTKGGEVIKDESEPTVNKQWVKTIEEFAEKKNIQLKIRPTTMHKSNGGVSSNSDSNKNNKNGSWWSKLWS
ncbi:MAG: DUF4304 domain-containing protein [Cytophagales bacterium]|nr:DUF4304 domain-containing protein [Cytophagales bacterium]